MTVEVEELLERFKRIRAGRSNWEDHWQRLGELMLPKRADFTVREAKGSRRSTIRYDGTPIQAARALASAIDGLIKPKAERWFNIKAEEEELNRLDAVKRWIADTEDRMYAAIYAPKARFLQATGETDLDLVVFGTAVLFTGLNSTERHLLFMSYHLKDSYIQRNADGEVDTMFIVKRMTPRQAAQEFGEANLGRLTKEAIEQRKWDEEFEFLWTVLPREDRDPRLINNTNMPFASIWTDVKSEHKIGESGYEEFPFQVPTWDNATDEIYGRSPGMVALQDANTLNAQGKTILRQGQKVVDPPLMAASESIIGATRTWAGGNTYFDVEIARKLGRDPVFPLRTGGDIAIGREMQNDTRDMIWNAFFRNILQLPVDRPQMTATEILERKEEFIRTIGPVFGRLESDYTGAVIDRVYNIMSRKGRFAEPPPEIAGRPLRFEYASPVQRAREQIRAASAARSAEVLAPYIEADPDILDNFDGDQIARDVGEASGMPPRWIRPVEDVEDIRGQRAQARQQAAELEAVERGVNVASQAAATGLIDKLEETPAAGTA